MSLESTHVSQFIARDAAIVYAYAVRPENLPHWAAGLSSAMHEEGGRWFADSPMGRVEVAFAPHNDFGVLDHVVTLPSGETVDNPVRVISAPGGSEVVFTLRRLGGTTAEQLQADAALVAADLRTLKDILETTT